MTNESIEALIHLLNQPESKDRRRDRVFRSALTEWVDFAVIWLQEPRGGIAGEGSGTFYFIKDAGQYVAGVFDMGDDLHAFTMPASRGRGLVTKALDDALYIKMVKERLELAYGDTADLCLDELMFDDLGTLDDRCEEFMERAHRRLGFPSMCGH